MFIISKADDFTHESEFIFVYFTIWLIFLYLNVSRLWHNCLPFSNLTDFPTLFQSMVIEANVVLINDGDGFGFEHIPLIPLPWVKKKNNLIIARLAGIDAPEICHRKDDSQELSEESKLYLASLVFNKKVFLKIVGIDKYRRLLVFAVVNNILVNKEMLKIGYAVLYRENNAFYDSYFWILKNAELFAKNRKAGVWGLQNFETPAEYKRRISKNNQISSLCSKKHIYR